MDLRTFLLNNASLNSRPKKRRHSIADVRFLHTLNDIPERPEEEESDKERRRSTGNFEKENEDRSRSLSEPPGGVPTNCCGEGGTPPISTRDMNEPLGDVNGSINVSQNPSKFPTDSQNPAMSASEKITKTPRDVHGTGVFQPVDDQRDENPRSCKRSCSVDEDDLKEAVSTYVLSYMDDTGQDIAVQEVSPCTTGSSSPQESSKETSDEELTLSEMLRKVETPMTTSRSRRGSTIDPVVLERITSLTPIVESSRSSSLASVAGNLNGFEASPDNSDENQACDDLESSVSSPRNADHKQDMLGKILLSPRLTRRGSLGDVLNSLSPQFYTAADPGRQEFKNGPSFQVRDRGKLKTNVKEPETLSKHQVTGNVGLLKSTHLSPQMRGQIKDPWRPLSPFNVKKECNEHPKLQQNGTSDSSKQDHGNVLGKIMNSPTLLKRRSSLGEVLHSLSPNGGLSPSPGRPTECTEHPKLQENGTSESCKEGNRNVLGKIMNSPTLLKRRSSLGDVLRSLSPSAGGLASKGVDTETSSLSAIEKDSEGDSPNKDKDGVLGRIIRSPSLTRRGSLGNVLNILSPNRSRTSSSPSPLTDKSNVDDDSSKTKSQVQSMPRDVERSPGTAGSKGLLAIVQKHVMNHSLTLQRQRSNSICTTKPHTGSLEKSLRNTLDAEGRGVKNKPVSGCKSPVVKPSAPTLSKDSLSSINSNTKSSSNNNNKKSEQLNVNTSGRGDAARSSRGHNVPSHNKDEKVKTPNPTDHSEPKEKSQTTVNPHDLISPTPRRLVESDSVDVPRVQSDFPSEKPPQRKVSAPLPPRNIDSPRRKTSVNVIKRSPVTFVISNDKVGRTEVRRNGSEYQLSSGVSFMNSRFLPLGKEEADEYSVIKQEEACRSTRDVAVNSTIKMSSRVTVHGGNGSIVRNLDSLPTDERFAALSERYASLKAKIGRNEAKQNIQESSPKPAESSDVSPNTEETLTQTKCWTTVESIRIEEIQGTVSYKRDDVMYPDGTMVMEDENKKKVNSDRNGVGITRTEINDVKWNDVATMKTVSEIYGVEEDKNIDGDCVALNYKDNNNNKPSLVEIEDGKGEIRTNVKTFLDLRPESPAQRTRTSVVAKLMNRKRGPRRKQSIVPRVTKRRSKVFKENCSGDGCVPVSAAQFEKIRTLVESTVLRAPVRQEVNS